MQSLADTKLKLDLATANILLLGEKSSEQDILAQMLMGFGVPGIQRKNSPEDATRAMACELFDLVIVDISATQFDGCEFIRTTRRSAVEHNVHIPIVIVCGHLRQSDFLRARDCGSNFIVTKPLSPQVLFDRIIWLARDRRQHVSCETYVGPDRRIKALGPPLGQKGRRSGDLSEHVGEATEANLSQNAVDSFFEPKRIAI
jgi:DNA-binding response OmpR family regulator